MNLEDCNWILTVRFYYENEKVNENCPYSFEHEISDLIKDKRN